MATVPDKALTHGPRDQKSLASKIGLGLMVLVFGTAAISKMWSFYELTAVITKSRLFPMGYQIPVATLVIGSEAIIAAALLIPATRQLALRAAWLITALYFGYSAWQWQQHIVAPCHCFGVLFTMSPPVSVGLNIILCLVLKLLMQKPETSASVQSGSLTTSPVGGTS